jgi:hypothetical protein
MHRSPHRWDFHRWFVLALIAGIASLAAAATAYGQTPTGPAPRDILERFARRAAHLIPEVVEAIERPIYPYFVYLAWVVAGLVSVFSFLRLTRHQEGTTSDTLWWFTRFAIFLAFLLGTNDILSSMAGIGHNIAYGPDANSFLARLVADQQYSFDESYRKFLENQFVVRVDDVDIRIDGSDQSFNWLGVLSPTEGKLEDVVRQLDPQSHSFSTLFSTFSIARTLMEGADLFLIVLSYVLMFALRLSAPFMVAVGVDRVLAGRIFNNYVWGAIVLTLILPIVSQITRIVVYAFGNVGMAIGDGAPLYRWDPQTLSVIANAGANPWYTVLLASFVMLIGALCLFASPYVSYKLCVGQVYESVSQVTAGWIAAIASTGVEMFSTAGAAALHRQAENTVAQGHADAGRMEATANRDAQLKRIEGQAIMSKASNNAAAFSQAAAARADAQFAATSVMNNTAMANRTLDVLAARETGENNVSTTAGVTHRRIENAQASQDSALAVKQGEADMAAGVVNANPVGIGGGKGSLGAGASPTGTYAAATKSETSIANSQRHAEFVNQSTTNHIHVDKGANRQRNALIATSKDELQRIQLEAGEANAAAALAAGEKKAGAAYGAAGMANSGVEVWRGHSVTAEGIVLDARTKSIDVNLAAAKEAADLRAKAAMVAQMGRSVAQRVDEMGDQLRY